MKANKKLSFALVFLTICILCSITSTTVLANTKNLTLDDIKHMDMAEYDAYLDTLSEEEQQELLESLIENAPGYCYIGDNRFDDTQKKTSEKIERQQQLEKEIEKQLDDISANGAKSGAYEIALPDTFLVT